MQYNTKIETKMKKILTLIVALLCTIATHADNFIGRYNVHHITTVEGLPGNTIRDIKQDADGFLWMAGTGGVARFDGYRFVSFNRYGHGAQRGIPRHIGSMLMSSSNRQLWVSSSTYNQACYDFETGRFVDYTGKKDDERPYRRIIESKDGYWMFSNTDGVRHVQEKDGKYTTTDFTVENHSLPSNRVRNLDVDGNGIVWVATDKGFTRIDRSGKSKTFFRGIPFMRCSAKGNYIMTFNKERHTAYIFNSAGRLIHRSVLPTAMGHIGAIRGIMNWRGYFAILANDATFLLDKRTGVFSKPSNCQVSQGSEYGHIGNLHFVGNRSGSLWIFNENGEVRRLDLFDNTVLTRDRNTIFTITRGKDGLYYIGSYGGGLFVYDYDSGSISRYTAEDRDPVIFSNYVLYVTTDRSGCVWVSTENGGVSCLRLKNNMAQYYLIDENNRGDWTNAILRFLPLPTGNKDMLLLETKANKIFNFSLASGTYQYNNDVEDPVSGYVVDRQGHTWTVSRGGGVMIDGKQMDVVADGNRVETMDYTDIELDSNGRIWLSAFGRGLILVKNLQGGKIRGTALIVNKFNESRINDIFITADGFIFVSSFNGMYVADIKKKNIRPSDFHLYHVSDGSFPADEVNCVCPAPNHIVWVGTVGGGLVRCDFSKGINKMTYTTITVRDGLSDNNVRSLVLDKDGYLWVGTDDGLSCVDPKDNYVRRYDLTNHVLSNTFTSNAAMRLDDNRLAFGTDYGLVIVNPALDNRTPDKEDLAAPRISDIAVNGISIFEGLDSTALDKSLSLSPKVNLNHSQNSLTFYYSSCNYEDLPSQVYEYYLEGLDRKWRPATAESHAEYSNLSPGNYVFHIRMVTPHGHGEETALKVHIAEPWYNTIWAWIFYIIIICVVAYWLYRNAQEKLRMNQQVKVEKQVAKFRTDFFTHVTHEFRTPLAILQNAVERISRPGNPSRKDIQTAQRGTRRLLRLVNQFLEYRRIENGKLHIQVEKDNIIGFAQDIFLDFRNMAEKKHINLNISLFSKEYKVLFDKQIVESVIYNIISNAVKYTPDNGTINFSIRDDQEVKKLFFTVEDNGPGIDMNRRADLFHPFMDGNVSKNGMGIGLYTSYRLAELHHGSLSYDSVTPHGSRFTFAIPDNDAAYSEDERAATPVAVVKNNDSHYDEIIKEMAPKALNSQLVAIVEDDPDMQEQIASEVGVYFKTKVYGNGNAAIAGIKETKPSLILCDIMLPDTNGYEVVKTLKADHDLAEVPIIMLTALEDESHQIKGYKAGADDYMVKPCNYHLLIARMMQLIQWHEKHQTMLKSAMSGDDAVAKVQEEKPEKTSDGILLTSRADKRFREQVEVLVSQHIGDQALSVDRLAEMMSMGRTKFYGKVKDVFGMSPNKYLMARRMESAASLLDEGKYNVSEVSYKVGFSDPAYFNKCFKSHFGMVPSKYKER